MGLPQSLHEHMAIVASLRNIQPSKDFTCTDTVSAVSFSSPALPVM